MFRNCCTFNVVYYWRKRNNGWDFKKNEIDDWENVENAHWTIQLLTTFSMENIIENIKKFAGNRNLESISLSVSCLVRILVDFFFLRVSFCWNYSKMQWFVARTIYALSKNAFVLNKNYVETFFHLVINNCTSTIRKSTLMHQLQYYYNFIAKFQKIRKGNFCLEKFHSKQTIFSCMEKKWIK